MIVSALDEDFLIFLDLPFITTSILIMQVPVLGIWGKEGSNPSLTANLCGKKKN